MTKIRAVLTLVSLKLRIIARKPVVLAVCLVLPILLTMLAGSTTIKNNYFALDAAYVDQAENYNSQELISLLLSGNVNWTAMSRDQAERELQLGRVDGVLIIPPHYGEAVAEEDLIEAYTFTYLAGENNLVSDIIRESLLVSVVTLASEEQQLEALLSMPGATDYTLNEMRELLRLRSKQAQEDGADLNVNFIGAPDASGGKLVEIPDFSMEVLFLSIFSLLGSLMLNDAKTRQRLLSVAAGPRRDYIATLLTLAVSGLAQLFLMTGITQILMPGISRPRGYYYIMSILLLMMLAYGQLIALIPAATRIMPASLILLGSVVAGGAFLRVPSIWIARFGQLLPHGWVMARLTNVETYLPPLAVVALTILALISAYYLQTANKHLSS